MSTTFRFFDWLDAKLTHIMPKKQSPPSEEVVERYMTMQGIAANIGLFLIFVVSWIVHAKMVTQFCLVYIPIMFVAKYFFERARRTSDIVFLFKIAMIIISSIYIVRMGGLHTSGGLFLLSVQAVTSTVILRDFRRILAVLLTFIVAMVLLAVLEPFFPTRYALDHQQNTIIFIVGVVIITGYIFFFSLYATNLYAKLEQRETQRQKELNDAKTRLYTNITHEFRTPLTVILGMANAVKTDPLTHVDAKMDAIVRNGKSLLQLVDQMLDLSKLDSGKLCVNKIHSNIIPFLKYIFQLQEFYAEEKRINMSFYSECQSYELDFDPEKLSAVVSNLLSNAIKFTPEGGTIGMKVLRNANLLLVGIKDNGIGIPAEKMEKIFDRFYQVDDQNTRKSGGAGIGLALTRELVHLMDGSIHVKSIPGFETEFVVKLPIAHEFKKENADGQIVSQTSCEEHLIQTDLNIAYANENRHLLIIEDNPDVVAYLKICYQHYFSIDVAADGLEGHRLALEKIPDVIVSDVMMPGLDGFELCKKLKNDYRTSHIPVILLTAKADIPSRIEGLEKGADAYVVKPFNQQELLVRMQKLLELRKNLYQRYHNGNGFEESTDPLLQKEDEFFKKLNASILKNLNDEGYNIQTLCEDMAMSKSQLYRKFKALSNQSAAKYIRTFRMKKARELLQTSNMNITEVGYEVGMKSLSTFSQLFKEEFGESPRDYLKHVQVNGNGKTP